METATRNTPSEEVLILFLWFSLCEKLNIQYTEPEDPVFTIGIQHEQHVEKVVKCMEYAYSGKTIMVFTHETCIEFSVL